MDAWLLRQGLIVATICDASFLGVENLTPQIGSFATYAYDLTILSSARCFVGASGALKRGGGGVG